MTTVRDITGTVDIEWSTGNNKLQRRTAVGVASTTRNSAVYKDLFVIAQLTTSHHGRDYQCKAVINTKLSSIDATGHFTLHVTGEYLNKAFYAYTYICTSSGHCKEFFYS